MPDPATKQCPQCRKAKPLSEFELLGSSPDGRRSRCRACWKRPAPKRTRIEPGEDNALRQYHRAYYQRNREKLRAQANAQRNGLPAEEKRRRTRQYYLRSRYGLGLDDWLHLWERQDRCCYLCGDPLIADEAALDHDHSCCAGYRPCGLCIRGLTHSACNTAIGLAGDSPGKLRYLADALEAAQAAVIQRRTAVPEEMA
jgi:Recombination endonuclease VII